uniref:Filamentous hemagglutinin-like protein n=1 Tax=Chlorobium chlorochromatii (strain CaD3) TaxID=340177 RepID=Q3ARQ8_CHLCH
MNRIFNVIWSVTREKWVVVSEKVKSNGSVPKSSLVSIAFLSALLGGGSVAQAVEPGQLPTGGVITAGSGSIATNGNSMTIQQSSQKMVANWNNFNVGSDASVRFQQPNASAAALNRIAGQNPSQILGSLSANGRVFLINPSGIVFGQNARVDVGGLVASTLDISDYDFLAGNFAFRSTGSAGTLRNEGLINAMPGGVVALLSPSVINNGTITAVGGSVALAAGNQMTLDFGGDGLMTVRVDDGAVNAFVENNSLIKADGGLVVMSAKAANNLAFSAVNNNGVVQAMSVVEKNGRILLDAEGGQSTVSGTLNASSVDGKGGQVVVTGKQVMIADGAHLNASGLTGGGDVLVGGSWQGSDASVRQAVGTVVMPNTLLQANAISNGNGGTVVVWSDVNNPLSVTRAYGTFEAFGGTNGGNGGRIETSGHWLDVAGSRGGASAVNGNAGVWLLDPYNVTISSSNANGSWGGVFPNAIWTASGDNSNLLASDITTRLNAGTSVTVQTGTAGSQAGDITVDGAINMTNDSGEVSLQLDAAGSIAINNNITNSTGTLHLVFNSGTGAISGTGALGSGQGRTLFNVGASTGTFSGIISGASRTVTKQGAGTLIFSGANTYGGLTSIEAGVLRVANAQGLGDVTNGTQVSNNGALELSGGIVITGDEVLRLVGTGVSNSGALHSIGNNSFGGHIILTGNSTITSDTNGTLILGNASQGIYGAYGLTLSGGGSVVFNGAIGATIPLASFHGLTGTSIELNGGSITTTGVISALGQVKATNPLTLSSGISDISLSNETNDFTTVTVTNAGAVSLIDDTALTLAGVNASGDVNIATHTGNLTVTGNVATTSATPTALTLNADQSKDAGNGNGENLILSSGTLTVGSGGIAKLYTGSVAGSTSIASVVNAGHFRYNSDEAVQHYTDPLTAGLNLIYREQPTLSVMFAPVTTTYGTTPTFAISSYSGYINGDTSPGIVTGTPTWLVDGTPSFAGYYTAGTHNVSYNNGLISSLGYGFVDNAISFNDLVVNPLVLAATSLTGLTASDKIYDGQITATISNYGTLTGILTGDRVALNSAGSSAAFADKNVGTGKTVTVSGLTLSGLDNGNYRIVPQTTTASITQKSLNVTAPSNVTKVYDGTVAAPGVATVTGLAIGDVVAGTATIEYADKMAGSNKVVNPLSVTILDGFDMIMTNNYAITYVGDHGTITQAPLTLTAPDNVTKYYDGLLTVPGTPSVNGLVPNDVVVIPASLLYTDPEVGIGKTVNPDSAGLVIHDAIGNNMTPNYAITDIASHTGIIVEKTFTPFKKWNDADPSVPEIPTNAPEVTGSRDLAGSDFEPATDSGVTATRSLTMATMDESAVQSDIVVKLAEPASKNKQGVVKVFVPKEVFAKPAFLFPLPEEVAVEINKTNVQEKVFMQNGDALPGWLSYDYEKKIFTATSAPAGSLPLTIMVQSGTMAWQVIIQQ